MKMGTTLTKHYYPYIHYFGCWILSKKTIISYFSYGDQELEHACEYVHSGNIMINDIKKIRFSNQFAGWRQILSDFRSIKPTKTFNIE